MSIRIHKPFPLFEEGDHRVFWLGLDEAEEEKGILANQYLVVDGDEALLVDPGGYHVFQRVYDNVSSIIPPEKVIGVFYSHQDPDVAGSLNLVQEFYPNARIYVSSLWVRFLPHLGVAGGASFAELPDSGGTIRVGGTGLQAIPAHFLHSPGNFTLYDPVAKILFSSDIGAAIFPRGEWYLFVEDFEKHVKFMEYFHKRYMACGKALKKWLSLVKGLEISIIAPQHGSIFAGGAVARFIEWLERIAEEGVGIDLI